MEEEFIIEGQWWLPDNLANKVSGTLHYKPNQLSDLQLFDDFESRDANFKFPFYKNASPPIIFGNDVSGNKITLIVVGYGRVQQNYLSSFSIVHYKIQYLFKGIHIESIDYKTFNEVEFEFDSLISWVNLYPVALSRLIKDGKLSTDFTLSYSRSEDNLIIDINDGFVLSIIAHAECPEHNVKEIKVKQTYIISIKSSVETDFYTFLKKCHRFQSFLNIATFQHNQFQSIKLYSEQHSLGEGNNKFLKTIEVFFKQSSLENRADKNSTPSYFFFYDQIQELFPKILKKWFGFDEKMLPILQHLMDSIQKKEAFRSVDFLIVVQALEGFQRRFVDQKPNEEKNLESRLKSLIYLFSKDIIDLRGIDTKTTVNSRDYYSHFYNKEENMKIIEGRELYKLTSELRKLLVCCLLRELGLDNNKINLILQSN